MTSLSRHNRKYGRLCNFVVIKVEEQNLADWGILMCTFQKIIYF